MNRAPSFPSRTQVRPRPGRFTASLAWLAAILCLSAGIVAQQQQSSQRGVERLAEAKPAAARVGNRWALIVGVDQYQDRGITPLEGAVADARAIRDALIAYADFPEAQTFLLVSDGTNRPTKPAIFDKLADIRKAAQPGDLLLLYFAGHGVEVDGQRYMLTYDAQCCSSSAIKSSAFLASLLMQELESIKVAHRIVMVDACRNDPTKGGKELNVVDEKLQSTFTLPPTGGGGLRATFLSSSTGQSAYEWTEKRRGFFSYFLEAGLKGEAAQYGKVTVSSLENYLSEMVPKTVRERKNRDQQPYTLTEHGADVILVRPEKLPQQTVAKLEPPRTIYGVVKDSAGQPLMGARVAVVVPGASRAVGNAKPAELVTTSDEDGFFKIDGVDAGAVAQVSVVKDGFESRTVSSAPDQAGKKLQIFVPRNLPVIAANSPAPSKPAAIPAAAPATPAPAPPPTPVPAVETKPSPPPPPVVARAEEPKPKPGTPSTTTRGKPADAKPATTTAKAEPAPKPAAPPPPAAPLTAKSATSAAQLILDPRAQELALVAFRTFVAEDFNEAASVARRALALEPDNTLANAVLGNSIAAVGVAANDGARTATAVPFIEKALQRDANQAVAHNALGVTLVAGKKYDAAAAEFNKAIASDPKFAAAHANLAHVLLKQAEGTKNPGSRLKDAEREYREAIKLQTDNSVAYNGLSTVLFSMGKYKDAIKASREAIGRYELRDGILGLYYVQMAVAQYQDGRYDEALETIGRARTLGVTQHDAYAIIEKGNPLKKRG